MCFKYVFTSSLRLTQDRLRISQVRITTHKVEIHGWMDVIGFYIFNKNIKNTYYYNRIKTVRGMFC